ncbi:MAG: DUF2076 domain-containing protein [Gammaproteobacteria bacterium]
MNTQERTQLSRFLQQLVEVKLAERNGEAEKLINDAVAQQPDAAYLLVQKSLLQDQALHVAQAQIADLQQQLQQKATAPAGSRFLHNDPWEAPVRDNRVPGAAGYRIPPADNAGVSQMPPQNQGPGFASGFLGNVASTAAGVVAGSFLFQGIGNLLGHHDSPSFWGQPNVDDQLGKQTTINNYYYDEPERSADNGTDNDYLSDNDDDGFLDDGDFDSDWG